MEHSYRRYSEPRFLYEKGLAMQNKFALRNYQGEAHKFYLVNTKMIQHDQSGLSSSPAHHIFVVDTSRSMSEDMADMKAMIEKLLVLEEYHNADTLFSLLSYDSEGNLVVQFSRIRVSELNQANSPEMAKIKAIEPGGSSCMSQAIDQALKLVNRDELTCISLHSDGYANDNSVTSEQRKLETLITKVREYGNVFVNTFAYRSNADFKLLSKIANSLSGRCLQATSIKEIFNALRGSTSKLVEASVKTYLSKIEDYDLQVFVCAEAQRINGASTDLKIRGVPADMEQLVYLYKEVSETEFKASAALECGLEQHSVKPLAAFAKVHLAMGHLNAAKYAMVSMRAPRILEQHAKALSNAQIIHFSNTLENICFEGLSNKEVRSLDYGFDTSASSVMNILDVLSTHAKYIRVDLESLLKDYQRSSVRRIEGSRDKEGKLIKPWLKAKVSTQSTQARLLDIVINRNDAEVDLKLCQDIELVNRENGESITNIAGIDLKGKLKKIKSYKLVTGGVLSVPSLKLKLESKQVFRQLKALGVCTGEYRPKKLYTVKLSQRPLVDYGFEVSDLKATFDQLCRYKVLISLFNALLKNSSLNYTIDQVKALQEHYISSQLNLNMPTTPEYDNLEQAIADGKVDVRTVYKIDVGSTAILNLSKFKSANAYLSRRFAVTINQEEIEKPTLGLWWNPGFSAVIKSLGSKTKLNESDQIMMPIFEDFFELGSEGTIANILHSAGANEYLLTQFKALQSRELDHDESELLLHTLKSIVKVSSTQLYKQHICPLVFYIGTTGILPDMMTCDDLNSNRIDGSHLVSDRLGFDHSGSEILDLESLQDRFPRLKLAKSDRNKT